MTVEVVQLAGRRLPARLFSAAARVAGAALPRLRRRSFSVAVVGAAAMRRLNATWHGRAEVTDVLSFPYGDSSRVGDTWGEVVICYPRAQQQARRAGWPVSHEVQLLLIHGLLHLAGYRDGTARERLAMRRREAELLRRLAPAKLVDRAAERS